jgi:hypothetical protein
MSANQRRYRLLVVLVAVTLLVLALNALFFLPVLGPQYRESVGSVEFEPPLPDGHPASLVVRLNLPPEFRVRYAREHPLTEAGVASPAGERLFYVTAEVVADGPQPAAGDLLGDYARRRDLTGVEGYREVSAEFRTTRRGAVWCQRYADVRRPGERARSSEPGGSETTWDRMEVLRYAEVWQGFILELEFYIDPGRADELAPLIWTTIEGMELAERPGP